MKIQRQMIALFAVGLFFLTCGFPAFTVKAESLPEETTAPSEAAVPEEEIMTEEAPVLPSYEALSEENDSFASSEDEPPSETADIAEEEISAQSDETALQETTSVTAKADTLSFTAAVEYSFQGYLVVGTFTEFPVDIVRIQPFYSLDDASYHECGEEWDLHSLESSHVAEKKRLICLYSNNEPLKSYLEGSLDHFYLKLRLTKEDSMICETQTTLIDRGTPQPFPEGLTLGAKFPSNMFVCEKRPFHCYGKYQITVKETASSKDITAVLPDTLPIEVQLLKKGNFFTNGIVDCPVTWKSLSLPSLTAGETVTIEDAAEEIIIPGGTLLHTPMGIFCFDEPFRINQDDVLTDEVRLVLNVVSQNEKPTGALTKEWDGLEMAFHQKPTGASSVRAYVISETQTQWTELPGAELLKAVNAQPSTANSGYALVLRNDQEPYRSYLTAEAAGDTPVPFFIGLEISGGVYDGQQLILAWPSSYELPSRLPKLGGSGGNESNAGSGNKGDSTAEGQRSNLPQKTDTQKKEQNPNLSQNSNTKKQNTQTPNWGNTVETTAKADETNQQASEVFSDTGQSPAKVQSAVTNNSKEYDPETIPTEDVQTAAGTENAVSEGLPVENKLSAAFVLPDPNEKGGHQPFLWIAAAVITGLGITLYTCKAAGRAAEKIRTMLRKFSLRK